MTSIPIALVGLGHRSVTWINHFLKIPGYRIVAVCDWIEPLMDKALALIPYAADVKRFKEYGDLLRWDGCEAVGLCVRRMDQGAMAADALEALEMAMRGESDFEHLFADLIDREPQLPEHLREEHLRQAQLKTSNGTRGRE